MIGEDNNEAGIWPKIAKKNKKNMYFYGDFSKLDNAESYLKLCLV